jgi:modulator of FtsH protease HflC
VTRAVSAVVVGLILIVIAFSALYTVNETEQVIITQFGQPIGSPHTDPGLHIKVPFIQQVHSFDKRWLEWDGDPNQIPTRDKKYIWVDTFSRWRIVDPLKFFQNVRNEQGAQSRLDDIVDGETRNVIANHDLFEVVRTSNRKFAESEEISDLEGGQVASNITVGRNGITREILKKASAITVNFGIELRDVQIKRVGYVADVQQKVYERMISERRRIAERSRSEGLGKSAEIRGQKERELKGIQSEAYKKAQELMGKADATASRIYAEAYSRDPEFYQFLKTMETYRNTISQDSTFLLSTDGDFFKYLTRAKQP